MNGYEVRKRVLVTGGAGFLGSHLVAVQIPLEISAG
jgi:nucleoside-diphosphate-sugar epimerase